MSFSRDRMKKCGGTRRPKRVCRRAGPELRMMAQETAGATIRQSGTLFIFWRPLRGPAAWQELRAGALGFRVSPWGAGL